LRLWELLLSAKSVLQQVLFYPLWLKVMDLKELFGVFSFTISLLVIIIF